MILRANLRLRRKLSENDYEDEDDLDEIEYEEYEDTDMDEVTPSDESTAAGQADEDVAENEDEE